MNVPVNKTKHFAFLWQKNFYRVLILIMRVETYSPPSFGGLTSKCAKNLLTAEDLIKYYRKDLRRTGNFVGTISAAWINKIHPVNSRKYAKLILDKFSGMNYKNGVPLVFQTY